MKLKAVIEIPMGSKYKFEIDKDSGLLKLDRVINQRIPFNYGYVNGIGTLCEDGDPLDVFVVSEDPIPSLTEVYINVYGVLKCKDNGVQDDKLLASLVGEGSTHLYGADTLISMYLETYKDGFFVERLESEEEALKVYEESVALFKANVF